MKPFVLLQPVFHRRSFNTSSRVLLFGFLGGSSLALHDSLDDLLLLSQEGSQDAVLDAGSAAVATVGSGDVLLAVAERVEVDRADSLELCIVHEEKIKRMFILKEKGAYKAKKQMK